MHIINSILFLISIPWLQLHEIYGWPVTWDFLKSGRGTGELSGITTMLAGMCWATDFPDAMVTGAVLIVEADYQVPVDRNIRGGIKSLLR